MCSSEYDIDETGNVISPLDILVKKKLIRKQLENDNLYYIEGAILTDHRNYMNLENFNKEVR